MYILFIDGHYSINGIEENTWQHDIGSFLNLNLDSVPWMLGRNNGSIT